MTARDLLIQERAKKKKLKELIAALFLDHPKQTYSWFHTEVIKLLRKLFPVLPTLYLKSAATNVVVLMLSAIVFQQSLNENWEVAVGKAIKTVAPKLDQIASTETVRDYNRAVLREVPGKLVWNATLDQAVCPKCADLDGVIFEVGTMTPPPLHPNCRCLLQPEE